VVVGTLARGATRIDHGHLDAEAVLELDAAHGRAEEGEWIFARTRGQPLFVVESLRALQPGDRGVPASLTDAVDSRVQAVGPELERTLRAASVIGTTFAPRTLADLLSHDRVVVVEDCERLVAAGLLARAGSTYEFSNDLVQEIVYAGTPPPLREAYHLRAAELFVDRPEAAATHAQAAGEWEIAADAWLSAGLQAAARYAVADGEHLLSRAVVAADETQDPGRRSTVRLERGRLRIPLGDFPGSLQDLTDALALAQAEGLRELELLVDREMCRDVLIGLGRPVSACAPYVERGLLLARELGDSAGEADLLARSAIMSCGRLQFVPAIASATRAVALSRQARSTEALLLALDGLKTAYAYLGDLDALVAVTDELEPLCRRTRSTLQLQWCVFERSFVPLAAGRWGEATALVEEALAISRRSGWTTFEGWFIAHLGWIARLSGRLDEAVDHGRRAVAVEGSRDHSWWQSTACALLAGSLRQLEGTYSREAVRILRQGLASADRTGAEGFRLRCLAGLADATGAPEVRAEAQLLLDGLDVPQGRHWMHGTDALTGLARAWLGAGQPGRAAAVLEPLQRVGTDTGWGPFLEASGVDALLVEVRAAAEAPVR
jgi:tetratricopeptide (TPR) repeat protein